MYGKSYKTITQEMTLQACIDEAFGEVQSLAEELREWSDNMQNSEGLSQTDKARAVEECADQLEEHADFDDEVPESIQDVQLSVALGVKRYRSDGAPSRVARLGNACSMMRSVEDGAQSRIEEIDTRLGELEELEDEEQTEAVTKEKEELESEKELVERVIERAAEVVDTWDSIDIPGMYG